VAPDKVGGSAGGKEIAEGETADGASDGVLADGAGGELKGDRLNGTGAGDRAGDGDDTGTGAGTGAILGTGTGDGLGVRIGAALGAWAKDVRKNDERKRVKTEIWKELIAIFLFSLKWDEEKMEVKT
jgi:hypothetical protein